MPHVSRRLLERNKFLNIHKEFISLVSQLSRSGKTNIILGTLLTKTEKLMLAKRLAIIILLNKKETIYSIEKSLKVSPSTVARMSAQYERGVYTQLRQEIKEGQSIFAYLAKIAPPRLGRNRFKHFLKF